MELTAHPIPKRRQVKSVALESAITVVALLLAVLGLIAAIGSLLYFGFSVIGISLAIIVATFLKCLLFLSLAEIIRLLKKIAQIDHAGEISGIHIETVLVCSHCDATLRNDICCDKCGARLVKSSD